ncbi:MAG: tRNA (N6-threonylcarbamoyladenosine(37)-N6)-methyltransferase TrmO [Gammaproteobacteria bacterium]|nr:tRNA (N6-threonylcarbamoyladenosine(37)-N6)-methyltransferase TrmO [Gammaproteobacteria bacterium]
MKIIYQQIGTIHSPFDSIKGMPIQTTGAQGIRGRVEVNPEYAEGLTDLEGFSHIILLYHFHKVTGYKLLATPFLDNRPHGIFAIRAPKRPNAIGLSAVRLLSRDKNILHIENVDILNNTPLLDIKPYTPEFDHHPADRIGWLEQAKGQSQQAQADNRFA